MAPSVSGVETVDDMLAFVRDVIRKKAWATISDHAVDVVKRVVMAACGVPPNTVIRGGPLRDGLFFYELPKKYSCAVALEGRLTFIKLADRDPDAEVTICAAASSSELGIIFHTTPVPDWDSRERLDNLFNTPSFVALLRQAP